MQKIYFLLFASVAYGVPFLSLEMDIDCKTDQLPKLPSNLGLTPDKPHANFFLNFWRQPSCRIFLLESAMKTWDTQST